MIFTSLTFWTLVAGLLAFVIKFFLPGFPFTTEQILAGIVFLLGFIQIYPQVRYKGLLGVAWSAILWSKEFVMLLVGLFGFTVRYYWPTFPLDDATLVLIAVFVLSLFQIYPEIRARVALALTLKQARAKQARH